MLAEKKSIEVIDLFCGIGGLSYGMLQSGMKIVAGFDIDKTCQYAYEHNNKAKFFYEDIKKVEGNFVSNLYHKTSVKVLAGCAPCQPFSAYAFKLKEKDSNKYDLLYEFGRIAAAVLPEIITMENVPHIMNFKLKPVLKDFVATLESNGYKVSINKVFCPDYGIPQARKRLVLLASRYGEIELMPPTHTPDKYVTVKDTIGTLPPIESGEKCKTDPFHVSRALTSKNMQRIKATPYGGGWKDWDESLKLECHKKESGKQFGSVYGRMKWDAPSPTMTTYCVGLGNGRFGHPEQNRAISLREAALFQTFPFEYVFFPKGELVCMTKASRYIGNAVPPLLGKVIAESIKQHLNKYNVL
ncbi:MAG: DNA cytosine methyltransferase [Bacteroidales bacterium]|jgi:DNA (cytosine-5)-methyltransferase 1|nr:DNA cytosine methyltransferase [Bacteroidales bacterium]